MKQTLQNLLAEGKTAHAIQSLLTMTKGHDADLHNDVLQISARFAAYEKEKHANTLAYDPLSVERNKINAAVIAIIEKLPDEANNSNSVGVTSSRPDTKNKWLKIGAAIVAAIGLIASIAQISGYSLKDFFTKEEKKTVVETPSVEKPKVDTLVIKPPVNPVKEKGTVVQPTKTTAKPQTATHHYEAKDQSKQINAPDNKGTININQ